MLVSASLPPVQNPAEAYWEVAYDGSNVWIMPSTHEDPHTVVVPQLWSGPARLVQELRQ